MTPAPEAMLADPRWFPDDMDTKDGTLSFVEVSHAEVMALPFLAQNWDRSARHRVRLKPETVLANLGGVKEPPKLNFLWHTGLCCSTLLSRALDVPGRNLSLREPQVALILAELKRYHYLQAGRIDPRVMEAAFRLFARPFADGEQILLKPANAATYLLPDAARLTTGGMVFLYSDCCSFLISLAKKHEAGMRFARRGFSILAGDGNEQFNWPMSDLMKLTDLRIAALMWHMEMAEFLRNASLLAEGRAVSLDCDAFLADPARVLGKIDTFLGLGIGAETLARICGGPLFTRDAKSAGQEPYGIERRRAEQEEVARAWGGALDEIVAWSYDVCPKTPRGVPLPNAIAPIEKAYHP